MLAISNMQINMNIDEVIPRIGIGHRNTNLKNLMSIIEEVSAEVKEAKLIKPSFIREFFPIECMDEDSVKLKVDFEIKGKRIQNIFAGADELAVAVCTIGNDLEKKVSDYFKKGEQLHGLIMEDIGNAALDVVCRKTCNIIGLEASWYGWQAGSPVNPGMSGLPLSEQEKLFQLVPADLIGVNLTSAKMMRPYKSTSMVMGVGSNMPQRTKAEVCAHCHLGKHCPYRVQAIEDINDGIACAAK